MVRSVPGSVFNRELTSDLRRAVETAQIAFPDGAPPLHQDTRLRECNYGRLNGSPVSRIAAQRLHRIDVPFPGGQSYRQVLVAMDAFLHDLADRRNGTRILLIAHSANRWALECLLTGASLEDLVTAPPAWRPGWHYTLPADWTATAR